MASVTELDCQLQTRIRSSFCVNSLSQCVSELVLNSLDARATSIAIRLNPKTFRIQVVDNGKGIAHTDLELLGTRYSTSKCHSLEDFQKRLKYYGFRGEALASIATVSECLAITSRHELTLNTYTKTIEHEQSHTSQIGFRPSIGTTVTVEGFMSRVPVRQSCIKTNQEIEAIKNILESLIIIQPKVSFSLRDDTSGKILIENDRCNDIITAFHKLHPHIAITNRKVLRVEKGKVTVSGLLCDQLHDTKKLQYFYVNKRPVACAQVQNGIVTQLKVLQSDEKHSKLKNPIYVIHVKCPNSYVDVTLDPAKTNVNFKKHDLVVNCIRKLIDNFLGVEHREEKVQENTSDCELRLSQMVGAIKGTAQKQSNLDEIEEMDYFPNEKPDASKSRNKEKRKTPDRSPQSTSKCISIGVQTSPLRRNDQFSKEVFSVTPRFSKQSPDNIVKRKPDKGNGAINPVFSKQSHENFPQTSKYCEDIYNDEPPEMNKANKSEPGFLNYQPEFPEETFPEFNFDGFDAFNQPAPPQSMMDVDDNQYCEETEDPAANNNPEENIANMTFFTYNPHNEEKGKNLVMDMFIKSVHVFPKEIPEGDCVQSPKRPRQSPVINLLESPPRDFTVRSSSFPPQFASTSKAIDTKKEATLNRSNSGNRQPSKPFRTSQEARKDRINVVQTPISIDADSEAGFLKPQSTMQKQKSIRNTPSGLTESPFFAKPSKPALRPIESPFFSKPTAKPKLLNSAKSKEQESPYFSKPSKPTTELFDSAQSKEPEQDELQIDFQGFSDHQDPFLDLNSLKMTQVSRKKTKTSPKLNETLTSRFFQDVDGSPNVFTFNDDAKMSESQIIVTLNENDKEEIIQRNVDYLIEENNADVDQWMENGHFPNDDNNIAGAAGSLPSPKQDLQFTITKRFDFMPKGMSPILKEVHVDPISPVTKRQFENTIVDSFQDELISVKWKNYLETAEDPKKFFEEIYAQKSKLIEAKIPNAFAKSCNSNMNFSRDLFNTLNVIAQVDYKFIAAINTCNGLLLTFDQHAVDERIRLENLLMEYKQNISARIPTRCTIFLSQETLELVKSHTSTLNKLGLYFECFTNGVSIYKIPKCLYNKAQKPGVILHNLLESLMKELIATIGSNNGNISWLPNVMQNAINSEACTGAIKFGDYLSKAECSSLLQKLSKCNLPFQCAHGRPTLAPIMFLNQVPAKKVETLNFHKLSLK